MQTVKRVACATFLFAASACFGERGAAREAAGATGSVEGRVLVTGEPAPETTVINSTDPAICGELHTLDDLVVAPDGGLRYAIVSVDGVPEPAAREVETETGADNVVIENTGCRFVPHAAVARVGATVEAVNDDPILHTTHLYGPADVNISLPVRGARSARRLDAAGLYVVKCDIHGWMQAFVRVDPHSFHAVTDPSGRFAIAGVPVGTYRLEVWHEKLGSREIEVQVRAGESTEITVEYPAE